MNLIARWDGATEQYVTEDNLIASNDGNEWRFTISGEVVEEKYLPGWDDAKIELVGGPRDGTVVA